MSLAGDVVLAPIWREPMWSVNAIFAKLGLGIETDLHRRVVLAYETGMVRPGRLRPGR